MTSIASRLFVGVLAAASIAVPVCADAADKLTVLLEWFVNPDHAPMVIAEQRGLFAREGLEVDLIPPADPAKPKGGRGAALFRRPFPGFYPLKTKYFRST